MKGDIGVGHVRYSTAGSSTRENAQPLVLNYVKDVYKRQIHTGQITAVIQHSLQSLRMSSLTMASTAHRLKIPTRIALFLILKIILDMKKILEGHGKVQ